MDYHDSRLLITKLATDLVEMISKAYESEDKSYIAVFPEATQADSAHHLTKLWDQKVAADLREPFLTACVVHPIKGTYFGIWLISHARSQVKCTDVTNLELKQVWQESIERMLSVNKL